MLPIAMRQQVGTATAQCSRPTCAGKPTPFCGRLCHQGSRGDEESRRRGHRRSAPFVRASSAPPPEAAAAAPASPAAAPSAGFAGPASAEAAFAELAVQHLATCSVALRPWNNPTGLRHGYGLFLTAPARPGDVVLRVPASLCLIVDYSSGLRVPPGAWPRLQRGVQKDSSLPWDILLALALLDALSGAGDPFWQRYSNCVLPGPLDLTLPLCFPPELLPELQHAAIISGAEAQQQRLAALFPGLSGSMCEGGPSWLQWGFACVRSRAFKLGDDCFAFAPFLDGANHADDPSCNFRLNEREGAVELIALKELQAGQEATISYTGPEGLTNQRLMAQYGFVPPGNPFDRLQFAALPAAAAAEGAAQSSQPVLLSLDRMQACLGSDERLAAAMSGRDPFAYAALKSLPFAADEAAAAELGSQVALAQQLLAELAAEAAAWPTALADDSQLVQQWRAVGGAVDARLLAAVEYRMQRKALVATCRQLLTDFVAG